MLSLVGLDSDNDADLARVGEWLDGEDDPLLDSIDLSEHIDNEKDIDWALHAAVAMKPGLQLVSWALSSDELLTTLDELPPLPSDDRQLTQTQIHWVAGTVAKMGEGNFLSLKGAHGRPEQEFWKSMFDEVTAGEDDGLEALFDGPAKAMCNRLTQIRHEFWPELEKLADEHPDYTDPRHPHNPGTSPHPLDGAFAHAFRNGNPASAARAPAIGR